MQSAQAENSKNKKIIFEKENSKTNELVQNKEQVLQEITMQKSPVYLNCHNQKRLSDIFEEAYQNRNRIFGNTHAFFRKIINIGNGRPQ